MLTRSAITKAKLKKFPEPLTAQLVWYVPDLRIRDVESLTMTLKFMIDTLVQRGVISDDNSRILKHVQLGPLVIARDNPRMELWLRPAD